MIFNIFQKETHIADWQFQQVIPPTARRLALGVFSVDYVVVLSAEEANELNGRVAGENEQKMRFK